jgi:hypothetical protein
MWSGTNTSTLLEGGGITVKPGVNGKLRWKERKAKGKVKSTLEQATKAKKGDVWIYSFFNLGVGLGGWSTPRPSRFTLWKETRYPLYKRPCGPQCRSGRLRKITPQPGFVPRTAHPVASSYTGPRWKECTRKQLSLLSFIQTLRKK